MPKITEHGGPSYGPMDAPNARPSEEAYTDAMQRHGTPDFTPEDQKLVERYQELRREEARRNDPEFDEQAEREIFGEAREEESSPGNSSSTSEGKQQTSDERNSSNLQSPVPTTENPFGRDQAGSSSAATTAGSTPETPSGRSGKGGKR